MKDSGANGVQRVGLELGRALRDLLRCSESPVPERARAAAEPVVRRASRAMKDAVEAAGGEEWAAVSWLRVTARGFWRGPVSESWPGRWLIEAADSMTGLGPALEGTLTRADVCEAEAALKAWSVVVGAWEAAPVEDWVELWVAAQHVEGTVHGNEEAIVKRIRRRITGNDLPVRRVGRGLRVRLSDVRALAAAGGLGTKREISGNPTRPDGRAAKGAKHGKKAKSAPTEGDLNS